MSQIKIKESVAKKHYYALINANENIKERNNISIDCSTNITVKDKSKSAYEYSVKIEELIEKCIDKDTSTLSKLNQSFLEIDQDSKKMIKDLLMDYK